MLPAFIVIVVLCIVGFGVAFYLGWFNVKPGSSEAKSRIASWVDTRKLKADKAAKYKSDQKAARP